MVGIAVLITIFIFELKMNKLLKAGICFFKIL